MIRAEMPFLYRARIHCKCLYIIFEAMWFHFHPKIKNTNRIAALYLLNKLVLKHHRSVKKRENDGCQAFYR